jgi:hypothetical protein
VDFVFVVINESPAHTADCGDVCAGRPKKQWGRRKRTVPASAWRLSGSAPQAALNRNGDFVQAVRHGDGPGSLKKRQALFSLFIMTTCLKTRQRLEKENRTRYPVLFDSFILNFSKLLSLSRNPGNP